MRGTAFLENKNKKDKMRILEKKQLSSTLFAWLLLTPSLIIVFAVVIYPLGKVFYQSFFDFSLIRPYYKPFVGFGNYIKLFIDPYFWHSIRVTLYFTFVSLVVELIFGLGVAILLNEDFKGRNFLRALIILPWAIPPVVNGAIWKWIFNANYGSFNALLWSLGLIKDYKAWFAEPLTTMHIIILADVWKYTPLVAILLLAGLQTIPDELYEASRIDGAGVMRRLWHITLPLLKPAILVVLIVRTFESFKVFDLIYMISRGGPASGTMVITYLTYLTTFKNLQVGLGSSMAYITVLFMAIGAYVYIRQFRTEFEY